MAIGLDIREISTMTGSVALVNPGPGLNSVAGEPVSANIGMCIFLLSPITFISTIGSGEGRMK